MSASRAVLVLATLSMFVVPVAAHGNYVSADPQRSADGTVRVELAVVLTDGFVALRTDDGGEIGRPVGHRAFEGSVRSDYAIELDDGYWANLSSPESLWVVLHRDDGDGRFEPGEDPVQTTGSGATVADRFALGRSDAGPVNVIAEQDVVQETDRNRVAIRRVRLEEPGYLVLRADEAGGPGRVVGHRALSAGEHQGVEVALDRSFYEGRGEDFRLWAVVHRGDGDDRFEAGEDPAVEVGGSPVMSRFGVERTDPTESTTSGTSRPTADTDTPTVRTGARSPESQPTTRPAETIEVVPPSPTPTRTPSEGVTTAFGQPGFGPTATVLTVLTAMLLAARRGERR